MSWLSKNTKSVTNSINPLSLLFPTSVGLTDGLLKASGNGGLFDPKNGPANPYGKPDLAFLNDTSKLDYLKDTKPYDFLKDSSSYDYLKKPVTAAPVSTFASNYKAPSRAGGNLAFNDLVNNINAPSSVDEVQRGLDTDTLNQLLSGIDTDTRNAVGSTKSDFADRGLSGPGVASDIEGSALAQNYADALKTKTAARTDFAGKELERQKAKELALRDAYKGRFDTSTAADTQDASITGAGAMADANAYNTSNQNAATRTGQNQLAYADLLKSGNQAYADKVGGNNDLWAQLINARDLGAAGINSSNYNAGVDAENKYKQPSIFDRLLNSISIGI